MIILLGDRKMYNYITNKKGLFTLGLVGILLTVFSMFFADRMNLTSFTTKANTYYSELVDGAPLLQNWSNISQIANEDDWTGVVSIQGYRGTGLTNVIGGSPTTVLGDSLPSDLRVVANQTNPLTSTAVGVAEFELADSTVALKPTDIATAPNLVVHLDASTCTPGKSVRISYIVRDIDNSPIDAVQPVSLQYRLGTSGNYSNVLFTTIPDATSGIGQATQVTPIFATLPNAVIGQVFDVRIITSNAIGVDEWVGIDNIRAECLAPTAASTSLRGRAVLRNGRGISRAQIALTNVSSNQTVIRYSNQIGYFNFQDLPVGDVYTIQIQHKRYTFETNTQTFQLLDDSQTVEFIAN
jgi:hypothetical protein